MTENNTDEKPLTTLAQNEQSSGEKIYGPMATIVGWIAELENLIGSSSKLHDLAVENARADIALSEYARKLGISMEQLDRINNLAAHFNANIKELDDALLKIRVANNDSKVTKLLKDIKDITGIEIKNGRIDLGTIDTLREKTKEKPQEREPLQRDLDDLGGGGQVLSSILGMTDAKYAEYRKDYNGHPPGEEAVEKDKNFIHLEVMANNEKNNVIGKTVDNILPGMQASLKTGTNIYRDHPDEASHALTTIIAILTVIKGIMLTRSAVGAGKFAHKKFSKRKNGSRKHHKNDDDDEPPSPDEGIHEKKSGKTGTDKKNTSDRKPHQQEFTDKTDKTGADKKKPSDKQPHHEKFTEKKTGKYTGKPSFRGTAGKSLFRRAMMMAGKTEIAAGAAEMGATLGEGATLAGTSGIIGEGALAGAAGIMGEGALAGAASIIGEAALGAAAIFLAPEVLIGGAAISAISAGLWGFHKYQQHQKKKQEEEAKAAKEAQAKLARNSPNLHQPDTSNPLQGPGGAFSPAGMGLPGKDALKQWYWAMNVSRTPTTVHHYTNCNNDYTTKNTVNVENLNTSNGYDFVHQMGNALHDIRWVNTQNCVR